MHAPATTEDPAILADVPGEIATPPLVSARAQPQRQIAILCAGLDRVRRGYETHTRVLFDALSPENRPGLEFLLFKRDGNPAPREISLRSPYREGFLCRILSFAKGDPLFWEGVFFALAFIAHLRSAKPRYEKIVVIEPVVAKTLHALKFLVPNFPPVLFTHGVCNPPEVYAAVADEIHEVNVENFRCLNQYLDNRGESKPHFLAPHFLADVSRRHDKQSLREKFGVKTEFVLLSVGAAEAREKRMDYVVTEAARLGPDWTLVICGAPRDKKLLKSAKRVLGDRFLHLYVDQNEIEEIYHLADVFVSASLAEGFGIAILEAMRASLPVITHDREIFRWILQDNSTCLDLTTPGNLADFLERSPFGWLRALGLRNRVIFEENYTWNSVRDTYCEMLTTPPTQMSPAKSGNHPLLALPQLVTLYYHRVFSRYFPRKLFRRLTRWTLSSLNIQYPRPGKKIESIDALLQRAPASAVVFIAHPDDETFCSGLLCELRQEDADVTLCCLTRGEGGFTGDHPKNEVGPVREQELRDAAGILGIRDVRFFDYVDPDATEFKTFAPKVRREELISKIHHLITEKSPDLVITHGSCGEYWHPAHILLHDAVKSAVAIRNRQADAPARLLTFNAWDSAHPLKQYLNESDAPNLSIDATGFHALRLRALLAHRTQQDVFKIFANGSLEDFIRDASHENYHLVS